MTINRREFLRALALGAAAVAAAAIIGRPPIDEIGDEGDDTEWPPEDDGLNEWVDDVWYSSTGNPGRAWTVNDAGEMWYTDGFGATWIQYRWATEDGWQWASNFYEYQKAIAAAAFSAHDATATK